jgi:diguanylate cyclase (GGDEF)-like protein
MRATFTHSAANTLYLAFIQFFLIVAILGAAESVFVNKTLMPVIPLSIALTSLALAIILSLLTKLVLAKKVKCLCSLVAVFSLLIFINSQLNLWGQANSGWFLISKNPFVTALTAVITFILFSALLIKALCSTTVSKKSNLIKTVIFFVMCIGIALWHLSAINAVKREAKHAEKNIHLIESMLNKNLDDHNKSFTRIKTRLEKSDSDDFLKLAQIDMTNYTKDYEIIQGMLLLDSKLELIAGDAFSKQFIATGVLVNPTVIDWLTAPTNEVKFAVKASTLDSQIAIIMFAIPITAMTGEQYQVLALLDLDLLIERRYINYLNSFDTFIELIPGRYFLVNSRGGNSQSLTALISAYKHFIVHEIDIMGLKKHDVYSFITNYATLKDVAKIDQLIIWFVFVFIYLFILAVDASFLLKKQSYKLYKMAKFDGLTGLLRREAFQSKIASNQLTGLEKNWAIVFLSLDGFNSVNTSLGHELGDSVLKLIATRLEAHAQTTDIIARFDNDKFVLFYNNTSKSALSSEMTTIINSLADIYCLGEVDIHLTVSAGIAMSEGKTTDAKLLQQQADIAMDSAKELGGNQFCFYQSLMDERHKNLVKIRGDLQKALNNGDLEVHYQPIHNLSDNSIVTVESLVRWKNGDNDISPAIFIPIAEQTGQILQVGEQVLTQVLNDISKTPELQQLGVAINFSPQQLQKQGFVEKLSQLVSSKAIQPQQLTIEVTETIMSEKGLIEEVIKQLIERGFSVAIDDFGTGYSSLSFLSRQPANIIKIDREFTLGTEQEGQKRSLLAAMINVCLELKKVVVIEGVEDAEIINYLSKIGNLRVQGYYFSKPLPILKLITYIHQQSKKG